MRAEAEESGGEERVELGLKQHRHTEADAPRPLHHATVASPRLAPSSSPSWRVLLSGAWGVLLSRALSCAHSPLRCRVRFSGWRSGLAAARVGIKRGVAGVRAAPGLDLGVRQGSRGASGAAGAGAGAGAASEM